MCLRDTVRHVYHTKKETRTEHVCSHCQATIEVVHVQKPVKTWEKG